MRFYTKQHKFYCGIDLHARSMYLCILDQKGKTMLHRNFKASPEAFLRAIKPFGDGLVRSLFFPNFEPADHEIVGCRLYGLNVRLINGKYFYSVCTWKAYSPGHLRKEPAGIVAWV